MLEGCTEKQQVPGCCWHGNESLEAGGLLDSWATVRAVRFGANLLPFCVNLLNPTGHVMHQQFNIQQLYILPTLYLCVLYLSENKQQLVALTSLTDWFL